MLTVFIVLLVIGLTCVLISFADGTNNNESATCGTHTTPEEPTIDNKEAATSTKEPPQNDDNVEPLIRYLGIKGDPNLDVFDTYIAGLDYHGGWYNIGGFIGIVMNDKNNIDYPDAMGVYISGRGLVGYIPAKVLKKYTEWSRGENCFCVGYIYTETIYGEAEPRIRGRVKAILPCSQEFVDEVLEDYLTWVANNMDLEYLPKELNVEVMKK